MTDPEFDALPADLRITCLLLLLRRPAVRRWAHREFGYPLTGPLTCRQLAAWCEVHEDTVLEWERQALLNLRGSCRRSGLTPDATHELKH